MRAGTNLSPKTVAAQVHGQVGPATQALVPPMQISTTYGRDSDGEDHSGRGYTHPHGSSYDELEGLLATLEDIVHYLLLAPRMAAASEV